MIHSLKNSFKISWDGFTSVPFFYHDKNSVFPFEAALFCFTSILFFTLRLCRNSDKTSVFRLKYLFTVELLRSLLFSGAESRVKFISD
ncbi:hypothetical protein CH380_07220 [Leptospira adleri]|uniref:Uncharacterized protein n=1 Tax=Leptospira adleri TaxID=2023186 RepID=A0A2M9YQJ8_9LEPT|nr:hypothetical protein CH380_07220 [Leptospira adleri]PJZ61044.1 hypothetical protein CH376_15180 [Leptospira adleri]